MADLLVHFATAFAPGQVLRDGRLRSVLYLGVCLPDLLLKALVHLGGARAGLGEPTHSPLGLVPWCYVAALLFEEDWRPRAFGALLAGSWLHLLIDAAKDSMGQGTIAWAFPFTLDRAGFALYGPDDTATLLAGSIVAVAVVELGALLRRRVTAPAAGP